MCRRKFLHQVFWHFLAKLRTKNYKNTSTFVKATAKKNQWHLFYVVTVYVCSSWCCLLICMCLLCVCASEFDEILRAWQWPFITATVRAPIIPKANELREQLGPVCRHLACLHLPYPLQAFHL